MKRHILEIDPEYYEAWNNLGLVYMRLNNRDKAIECYEKVLTINCEYKTALRNLRMLKG